MSSVSVLGMRQQASHGEDQEMLAKRRIGLLTCASVYSGFSTKAIDCACTISTFSACWSEDCKEWPAYKSPESINPKTKVSTGSDLNRTDRDPGENVIDALDRGCELCLYLREADGADPKFSSSGYSRANTMAFTADHKKLNWQTFWYCFFLSLGTFCYGYAASIVSHHPHSWPSGPPSMLVVLRAFGSCWTTASIWMVNGQYS